MTMMMMLIRHGTAKPRKAKQQRKSVERGPVEISKIKEILSKSFSLFGFFSRGWDFYKYCYFLPSEFLVEISLRFPYKPPLLEKSPSFHSRHIFFLRHFFV